MADLESNQTQGSSRVIHLPVPAKRRGRRKPAPEAPKSVVLTWKMRADKEAQAQQKRIEEILLSILEATREGEVRGLWFMVDNGDGRHQFGLHGTYKSRPDIAYMPACKAMYKLSEAICKSKLVDW